MIKDSEIINTSENSERKLTEEEYRTILDFIYSYRFGDETNESNQMYEILRFLTEYFGCKCASLWLVNPDSKMTSPMGFNVDSKILEDYELNYQFIDEYHVKNVDPNEKSTVTVVEMADNSRNPSDYSEALKERNIYQRYGIIMRENGQTIGAIGLFKSTDKNDDESRELSPFCLEVIAPFIAQEFIKTRKMDPLTKSVSILHTVLNTSDVGIALFDSRNPFNIIYYNPICTKYCYELSNHSANDSNIIATFISGIIQKLGNMWVPLKDASFELSSNTSRYRIRVVENSDENGLHTTCTLFIMPASPNGVSEGNDFYPALFSQLTTREQEIAMMIAQGYTNSEIADKLFISLSTVKSHVQHIFEKADVSNRTSLMALLK